MEYVFVVMVGLRILENVLRLHVQKKIVKLHGEIMVTLNRTTSEWEALPEEKLLEIWAQIAKENTRDGANEIQQRIHLNLSNNCVKSIFKEPAELAKAYILMPIKSQEKRSKRRGNEDQYYGFDSMDIVALLQIMKNCSLFQDFSKEMLFNISDIRNKTYHSTKQTNKFNNDDKPNAFEGIEKMMEFTLQSDNELLEEIKNVYGDDPQKELSYAKNLATAIMTSA